MSVFLSVARYGKFVLRLLSQRPSPRVLVPNTTVCVGGVGGAAGGAEVEDTAAGLTLYRGRPGAAQGHLVETSSYFDR